MPNHDYDYLAVVRRPTFKKDLLEMVVSIFIMSFGVVLSVKACQGATPIVSFPNVLSLTTGMSLGLTLLIVYSFFILIEWIILRDRSQILLTLSQLPFTLLFSAFIDAIEFALDNWVIADLWLQWVLVLIGTAIISFSIVLEVDANVSMLADDGLCLAIHIATKISLDRAILIVDVCFVASSFILSWIVFHDFVGVGLGTIFAGLTQGMFVKFFTRVVKCYIRKDGSLEYRSRLTNKHGVSETKLRPVCLNINKISVR